MAGKCWLHDSTIDEIVDGLRTVAINQSDCDTASSGLEDGDTERAYTNMECDTDSASSFSDLQTHFRVDKLCPVVTPKELDRVISFSLHTTYELRCELSHFTLVLQKEH